ncbi:MAG TPA: cytochrome c-type biogenesis CcmF C-terminal domain-containing protein [Thermoleophilaceae bacterium]|nr:cytochrome c-type biogenesis CcmF C-terminal domain-containing protein [Thermoleophilaceae bacterium]
MAWLGSASLVAALLTALYAAGASLYGGIAGERRWVLSGRRAVYCMAALLALAMAVLEAAFIRSDFSFELVARNSSEATPAFYKVTAMWSSQEGSLLLWVFLLSVYSTVVLALLRNRLREIAPYATAVLSAIAVFFLALVVFAESPFTTLAAVPADGQGLNPLLRHPAMMIHPPLVYSGYVGFSIPFAFAIGALITRRTGAEWIQATRRYALIAWTFLGFGIMLGALWSYTELGWGGYWAWDPVENASLMPWLTGTAFIHSVMIQEKRGMLRRWNASLIAATFVLALLGTFLVRSGILDSIHAFGASTLGKPFLGFIAVVLVGSVALIASRWESLRSEGRIDSLMSREAVFAGNNLVLVGICFVVFWGTFFPLISEAVTGTESTVGPPWFNRYVTPLALVLVLLAAIGPLFAWRRMTARALRRAFLAPGALTLAALVAMLALTPAAESPTSLLMFSFVAFLLGVVVQEFSRGVSARRTMTGQGRLAALGGLVSRNRRRYGGYIVHSGIALLFLGVAASSAFVEQRDARLAPGESIRVGDYTLTYREPTARILDDRSGTGAPVTLGAAIEAEKDGKRFKLLPSRNYYGAPEPEEDAPFRGFFEGEATSEVDVRWGLVRDLWVAVQPDLGALEAPIAEADREFRDLPADAQGLLVAAIAERFRRAPSEVNVRVLVSPLIAWIWIGSGIAVLGALVALWPEGRRPLAGLYAARVGREAREPAPA